MKKLEINFVEDFTDAPGGRHKKNGPYSGEAFRDDLLLSLLDASIKHDGKLVIDFDSTYGYPISFLSEVFSGFKSKYELDSSFYF